MSNQVQCSPSYWWITIGKIRKSTKIPLSDITKATILLREVQKKLLEKRAQAEEISGESVSFSQLIKRYLSEVSSAKRSKRADYNNAQHPMKFFGEQWTDTIKPILHNYEIVDCSAFSELIFFCISPKNLLGGFFDSLA